MNKLKLFLILDFKTKLLFLEAITFLAWARILKFFPLSRISPFLGEFMKETPLYRKDQNVRTLRSISKSIQIMSRYTFWESQCLVKAIAAMKMLERRKIDSTLYLGTGKDGNGKLVAHAWLRSGPYYITGSDGMEKYTVIGKYAKKIGNKMIEGEGNG